MPCCVEPTYFLKIRVTLIKSTLSIMTTYYMPLFTIPISVSNQLKKLQRDCLCLLGKGGVSGGKESAFGLLKIGGITNENGRAAH